LKNVTHLRLTGILLLLVLALAVPSLACGFLQAREGVAAIWTPEQPGTAQPSPGAILPTAASVWTNVPTPTLTPRAPSGVTPTRTVSVAPSPTRTMTALPTVPPTPSPQRAPSGAQIVIITEEDIAALIASNVAAERGLDADNMDVRFSGGRTRITASRASYGVVRINNLVMVGRLVAVNGVLQMQTESISPPGLITALVPTLVNQSLQQYAAEWYVEDVTTHDGYIELVVR
jgi:hypothetical protein